jgi:hypothetical protein
MPYPAFRMNMRPVGTFFYVLRAYYVGETPCVYIMQRYKQGRHAAVLNGRPRQAYILSELQQDLEQLDVEYKNVQLPHNPGLLRYKRRLLGEKSPPPRDQCKECAARCCWCPLGEQSQERSCVWFTVDAWQVVKN